MCWCTQAMACLWKSEGRLQEPHLPSACRIQRPNLSHWASWPVPFSSNHLTNPDFMMTRRCSANQIFMASLSLQPLEVEGFQSPPTLHQLVLMASQGFVPLLRHCTSKLKASMFMEPIFLQWAVGDME